MKVKKLLASVFSTWLVFCAVTESQAVVLDKHQWEKRIRVWVDNRETKGNISAYVNCITKRNSLCRAINTVEKYYGFYPGEPVLENLYHDLQGIWGLDSEIKQSWVTSETLCELHENLINMAQAYYSVAVTLQISFWLWVKTKCGWWEDP